MSDMNEMTNPTTDPEPMAPVEPAAAAVLDDMNQAIEGAAADVKATGDELAAAAEQIDVLTVAPVSAPVLSLLYAWGADWFQYDNPATPTVTKATS